MKENWIAYFARPAAVCLTTDALLLGTTGIETAIAKVSALSKAEPDGCGAHWSVNGMLFYLRINSYPRPGIRLPWQPEVDEVPLLQLFHNKASGKVRRVQQPG